MRQIKRNNYFVRLTKSNENSDLFIKPSTSQPILILVVPSKNAFAKHNKTPFSTSDVQKRRSILELFSSEGIKKKELKYNFTKLKAKKYKLFSNKFDWPKLLFVFLLYYSIISTIHFKSIHAVRKHNSLQKNKSFKELTSDTLLTSFDEEKPRLKKPLSNYQYATAPKDVISFTEWVNKTQQASGIFLNHSSYCEGEVLLFRTKKNRHRAIAVMNVAPFSSKFVDALTFKEWLKTVYPQKKALKVSVRTTEVVRPVLQQLYASKEGFKAPIIVHANTFANNGRYSSSAKEKPVDIIVFLQTVSKLLPEAAISLGWTQSSDYATINHLDWAQTFRLMSYVYDIRQPIIINMRLNDAVHSIEQLEWLLGVDANPQIYVVLHGEITDFVDSDLPLKKLALISENGARKILFDVDESWRERLNLMVPEMRQKSNKKEKRSIELETWENFVFANSHEMLSTSIVSSGGVAFLGWPNSLFVSTRQPKDYPSKQRISGRVMFLPKRQSYDFSANKESGMTIQLFDGPIEMFDSITPNIKRSIKIFIGYEGRVSIENRDIHRYNLLEKSKRNDPSYYSYYHKSSVGQLPKWPCYEFQVIDKGWRVELDIWSIDCNSHEVGTPNQRNNENESLKNGMDYRLYLQLDTPITRTRKTRNVAIGKSGDGAIDFLFREINHTNWASTIFFKYNSLLFFSALKAILAFRLFA